MPSLTATAFLRPDTLDEALAMLGDDAVAIAGGTAVILHPPPGVQTLVDIGGVLPAEITETEGGVDIGAMATLTSILEHPLLADAYDGVLAEMLHLVGSPLLRNAATIGGHLGRGRISDVIPLLIALGASVTFYDGDTSTLPLEEFYAAERHRDRLLITGVTIPKRPEQSAAAFHKLSRTHFDLALINAAARVVLVNDVVAEARIVVGETPALGARVAGAEDALAGGPLTDEAIDEAAAIVRADVVTGSDSRASAEYRTQLAGVVVTRCLTDIRSRLGGER